jgi:transcriptional regulator with XRE-family HTH domain
MEFDMYTNAQVIRKLREDRAWSQEHLAAVAGLSARTIQRLEAEGSASRETRMAIAAALGVELSQLNGVEANEPPALPAPAVAAAMPPPAAQGYVERIVWRIIVVALVLVAFMYTVGKDLATRDYRADCAAGRIHDCTR